MIYFLIETDNFFHLLVALVRTFFKHYFARDAPQGMVTFKRIEKSGEDSHTDFSIVACHRVSLFSEQKCFSDPIDVFFNGMDVLPVQHISL